ncbi:MAG: peptidoglycan-binding domain-containing protein [Byssovorax sp.]
MSSLAQQFTFLSWRTIYDDPRNESLRAARPNPNVLAPGDKVFIPRKQPRTEESPTGTRAVYRVLTTSTRLRIAFAGKRVNDYELRVGGQTFTGQVGEGGLIDHLVPASATEGDLVLRPVDVPGHEDRWKILLGALDPIEKLTGVQARLNNLGFPCKVDGGPGRETTAAIQAFQRWRGLSPQDGKLDAATRAQIQAVHDG